MTRTKRLKKVETEPPPKNARPGGRQGLTKALQICGFNDETSPPNKPPKPAKQDWRPRRPWFGVLVAPWWVE